MTRMKATATNFQYVRIEYLLECNVRIFAFDIGAVLLSSICNRGLPAFEEMG